MKNIFILLFCFALVSPTFANNIQDNTANLNLSSGDISQNSYTETLEPSSASTTSYNEDDANLNVSNTLPIDWNSYITDLCLKIKSNWRPYKGGASGRAIVSAKIGKNGELISIDIKNSSGLKKIDNSALEAIKASAPFSPFPIDSTEADISVPFKFFKATNSYNVTF